MSGHDDNSREAAEATLHETAVAYSAAVPAGDYPLRTPEDRGWEDFRDQCRRQMQRPLELRIKYGFAQRIRSDDDEGTSRSFDTMAQYRAWCEANLPSYLGFKRPDQ